MTPAFERALLSAAHDVAHQFRAESRTLPLVAACLVSFDSVLLHGGDPRELREVRGLADPVGIVIASLRASGCEGWTRT